MIRTVGDGQTIIYIQDILVLPDYQRRGIGTALARAVLERFREVRQIVLSTDNTPQTNAFYESPGLVRMSSMGCRGFMKT